MANTGSVSSHNTAHDDLRRDTRRLRQDYHRGGVLGGWNGERWRQPTRLARACFRSFSKRHYSMIPHTCITNGVHFSFYWRRGGKGMLFICSSIEERERVERRVSDRQTSEKSHQKNLIIKLFKTNSCAFNLLFSLSTLLNISMVFALISHPTVVAVMRGDPPINPPTIPYLKPLKRSIHPHPTPSPSSHHYCIGHTTDIREP